MGGKFEKAHLAGWLGVHKICPGGGDGWFAAPKKAHMQALCDSQPKTTIRGARSAQWLSFKENQQDDDRPG